MADSQGDSLAIVVVNYGSSALLAAGLAPLARAHPNAVTVVVDNRTDTAERGTVTALAEAEGWILETPDDNPGFGAGINRGARRALAAGATSLLLINPDATITTRHLATLRERLAVAPDALLSPRILRPDGTPWFSGADLYLHDGRLRNVSRRGTLAGPWEPWLSGACLLVHADLWQRIGGFDERYFLYWEDVDLSHRVLASGGTVEVVTEAIAVHDEGGTHLDRVLRRKSDTYYYYSIRNRALFAALNLDAAAQARWRRNSLRVAWEVLLQGGRRQLLRSPGLLLLALRALRHGEALAAASRKP